MTRRSTGTDYRVGLRRFRGDLDFPLANQAAAASIIDRAATAMDAEVTEVWWDGEDPAGPRLRVDFSGVDDTRLFVYFGYVHHRVELPGSIRAYGYSERSGWWETHLPENRLRDPSDVNATSAARPVCPNCFLEVPMTGICDCGWSIESNTA